LVGGDVFHCRNIEVLEEGMMFELELTRPTATRCGTALTEEVTVAAATRGESFVRLGPGELREPQKRYSTVDASFSNRRDVKSHVNIRASRLRWPLR
jgi:hypothetical protein